MTTRVFEGTREQIAQQLAKVEGRVLRAIVEIEEPAETEKVLSPAEKARAFVEWVEAHAVVTNHPVDDSRESIYSGTIDDPR